MITYDGLRVLMMAEDDSRCCFGLFGPLFHPYIVKKRPIWVVFQGASDGNVKTRRNIAQKSKNNEKLDFRKIDFLKIQIFIRIDAPMYFLEVSTPGTAPKYPKNPIFQKLRFLWFL